MPNTQDDKKAIKEADQVLKRMLDTPPEPNRKPKKNKPKEEKSGE